MSQFTEEDRAILTEIRTDVKHVKEQVKDHEQRIRDNTRFRHTLIGWVAGSGALGAALVKHWPFSS